MLKGKTVKRCKITLLFITLTSSTFSYKIKKNEIFFFI